MSMKIVLLVVSLVLNFTIVAQTNISYPTFKGDFNTVLEEQIKANSAKLRSVADGRIFVNALFKVNAKGQVISVHIAPAVNAEIDSCLQSIVLTTSTYWEPQKENGRVVDTSIILLVPILIQFPVVPKAGTTAKEILSQIPIINLDSLATINKHTPSLNKGVYTKAEPCLLLPMVNVIFLH